MIPSIQIEGPKDLHPEHPIHDAADLAEGRVDLSKLRVSRHRTCIFNLMDKDQRDEYDRMYVDLCEKSRAGKALIGANERATLSNGDGSTGWYRIIEWTEFDTSEILGA